MTRAPRPARRARATSVALKPLAEQVIVITGASCGVGLATARIAARRGARVVIGARNGEALQQLAAEIEREGGEVAFATVDVDNREHLEQLADIATNRFGRIDTWVNNPCVSIQARLDETPIEDMQRLFDTDFQGVVHGSLAAVSRLKRTGGALINVAGLVPDFAMPPQGAYSAPKEVEGFTDALRLELERERARVSVTLIKSAPIDTLVTEHVENLMRGEPKRPPPVHAPEVVAEAILHAAQHPQRDIDCGGTARAISARAVKHKGTAALAALGVAALTAAVLSKRAPRRTIAR